MSGEKEVRLREGEYRRLMNAARQVENNQSRASALDGQLRQAQQQIDEQRRAADGRHQAFERTIGNLSAELQSSAREFNARLSRQQQTHAETMRSMEQETAQRFAAQQREFASSIGDLDRRLTEQGAEFSHRVEQLDQRLAGQRREYLDLMAEQTAQVEQQFARIAEQRHSARQDAVQWLADSQTILDYIQQHQRHQQFAPGEFDLLKGEAAMSRRNLDAGHEQAAIATGQALYGKALKLQAEIEFRQQEWDTWYSEALTNARAQLAVVEVQQGARWVFDTDQGVRELDAEIDYWSDGALSALKERIAGSLQRLEQGAAGLSLADLKAEVEANRPLQAELERIVTDAKERLIASQLRVNIAEDVLSELEAEGWRLQEDAWAGQGADAGKGWKNAYHLKLRDQAGDEMITIVLPEETPLGSIENRIQFAYYPKDNNDARFAARQTERLSRTLARLGLTQEGLHCVPGHERTIRGDEVRRDFDRVRASAPERSRRR
ncbi:hypothetical protein [Candidatus Thiodictyon syntrophicum]|jgi:hypothetical protein|uniref:Uncharacterized protein n=1 Tax=Candidatus Thiodictyon syntrophicum TaxID=1166950 RepID=A0A2K8U6A8_9GAMM|nr:hypothetical protein [Candidatus Thiodictyon syntrophicum]AUB80571.1 hypothetical protein THSYN_06145 [Candidatus Thiodictyon syntrophicum]